MGKFIDLTGYQFGRLTVLGISKEVQSGKRKRYYWACKCKCGNLKEVRSDCLTSGYVQSCGCLKKEQDKINLTKFHRHRLSNSHIWHVYYGMLYRCYNPNSKSYKNYGARGIKVCEEWKNSFDTFATWAKENGCNEGLQIDRIDNNGNYEPDNCRWVNARTQSRNRRSNIIVNYQGQKMTLIEAAELSGISYAALNARYNKGIRGNALFANVKAKGSPTLIEYKGNQLTLRELAKITDININTLKSRYRIGKRGNDLIK